MELFATTILIPLGGGVVNEILKEAATIIWRNRCMHTTQTPLEWSLTHPEGSAPSHDSTLLLP